ncbi:hypothetical protein CUMW_081650 [Citrus unshiu]|nr:hypothetical protein CUMW_081650 [Citrus unshiu]
MASYLDDHNHAIKIFLLLSCNCINCDRGEGGRIFGWWHSSAVRKYQCLFTSVCDHLPSIEVKGSCNLQELVCLSGELFLVDGLLLIGIACY